MTAAASALVVRRARTDKPLPQPILAGLASHLQLLEQRRRDGRRLKLAEVRAAFAYVAEYAAHVALLLPLDAEKRLLPGMPAFMASIEALIGAEVRR